MRSRLPSPLSRACNYCPPEDRRCWPAGLTNRTLRFAILGLLLRSASLEVFDRRDWRLRRPTPPIEPSKVSYKRLILLLDFGRRECVIHCVGDRVFSIRTRDFRSARLKLTTSASLGDRNSTDEAAPRCCARVGPDHVFGRLQESQYVLDAHATSLGTGWAF